MLSWTVENQVIKELFFKGKNIINPWGIETADSWTFFSMEKNVGYRYEQISFHQEVKGNEIKTESHVLAREGEWIISTHDTFHENIILREAKLSSIQDSVLMDFVVRMRFKKSFFDYAEIDGKRIVHEKKNIYYQYPVEKASLVGKDVRIDINILEANGAGKFKPHLYVRDHEDEWVVHARMIPIGSDKNVIKLCSRYFSTSPLPQFISNLILSFDKIRNYLWYRGEHSPYKSKIGRFFGLNAFPMVRLKANDQISWRVEVNVS